MMFETQSFQHGERTEIARQRMLEFIKSKNGERVRKSEISGYLTKKFWFISEGVVQGIFNGIDNRGKYVPIPGVNSLKENRKSYYYYEQ
jgi:hypothetical protein